MEWNFLFRVDHLNERGEERNLKGLIFTEGEQLPSLEQIQEFLISSGYEAEIKNPEKMVFTVPRANDPIEIKIVKLGNEKKAESDRELKMLSEQFMKKDPFGL